MFDLVQNSLYRYPSPEGAKEVAKELGCDYELMMDCQDWEYTFPVESDLDKYFEIYNSTTTSKLAKRVLASFILQSCNDRLCSEISFDIDKYITPLFADIDTCQSELEYWSGIENHPVEHPDYEWKIAPTVRKHLKIQHLYSNQKNLTGER